MENSNGVKASGKLNRSLFQISDDVLALQDLLEEIEGDISEEQVEQAINEWFVENEKQLVTKLDSYGYLVRENEGRTVILRQEVERLQLLARSHEGIAKRLKNLMLLNFNKLGIDKFESVSFRFSVSGNGGKFPIEVHDGIDAAALPPEFQRHSVEIDMESLRAQLEAWMAAINDYRKKHPACTEDDAAEALKSMRPEALKYADIKPRGQHVRIK
jgi:hypothetical protein